jgi:hypothetical protein
MSDVLWHLNGAKAELESAHAAALKEDKVFAHEVCQMLFAVGLLGEAWKAKQAKVPQPEPRLGVRLDRD